VLMHMSVISRILGLALLLLLSACGLGTSQVMEPTPTGLTLGVEEVSLPSGYIVQLQPKMEYSDGTSRPYDGEVLWETNDESVARAYVGPNKSKNLLQTRGTNDGSKCTIKLMTTDKKYVGRFDVKLVRADLMALEPQLVNGEVRLTGRFERGYGATKQRYVQDLTYNYFFYSTNPELFTISSSGVAQILNEGSGSMVLNNIFPSEGGHHSFEYQVDVNQGQMRFGGRITPKSLEIVTVPSLTKLPLYQQVDVKVIAHYEGGRTQDVTRWAAVSEYLSDNFQLLRKFGENGVLTGYALRGDQEGEGNLGVDFAGAQAKLSVEVVPAQLESISVVSSKNIWKWPKGEEVGLTVKAKYVNDDTRYDITSNPDVLWTVTPTGILERVTTESGTFYRGLRANESAVLKLTYQDKSVEQKIEITPAAIERIEIDKTDTQVAVGGVLQLMVNAIYTDRTDPAYDATRSVESGAEFASVAADGKVTGLKEGVARIGATLTGTAKGTLQATADISVTPMKPSKLVLSAVGGKTLLSLGEKVGLSVRADYNGAKPVVDLRSDLISWQVDPPGMGAVTTKGEFVSYNIGNVTLVGTYEGVPSNPLVFEIAPKGVASVAIDLPVPARQFPAGIYLTPILTVIGTDGSILADYEYSVQWQTSDANVAEVINGVLQLNGPGNVIVSARVNTNHVANLVLQVTAAGLPSISVSLPAVINMVVGEVRDFSVTYVNADGNLGNTPSDLLCMTANIGVAQGSVFDVDNQLCSVTAMGVGTTSLVIEDGSGGAVSSTTQINVTELPSLGTFQEGAVYDISSVRELDPVQRYSHVINGLPLNRRYTVKVVTANGATLRLDKSRLWVAQRPYSFGESCLALAANRNSLACGALTSSGKLYVGVLDDLGGVPYRLQVMPEVYENEGSTAYPAKTLQPAAAAVSGMVSSNAAMGDALSIYKLAGLEANTSYVLTMSGQTEVVYMNLYSDSAGDLCPQVPDSAAVASALPSTVQRCEFISPPDAGNLTLRVYGHKEGLAEPGASAIGGASYNLQFSKAL